MWTHEETIEIFAAPARVWEFFEDVARWKEWNAGIESIELHGPFQAGTTFTMKPPGQEAITSTLLEVIPHQRFVDETVLDGTRVVVDHQLVVLASGGTKIIYRTEITGAEAQAVGPMVTADFGDVLAALKRLAEQK